MPTCDVEPSLRYLLPNAWSELCSTQFPVSTSSSIAVAVQYWLGRDVLNANWKASTTMMRAKCRDYCFPNHCEMICGSSWAMLFIKL